MFALRNIATNAFKHFKSQNNKYGYLLHSQKPLRNFSTTQKKLYGCQKARDNYEELVITMKKNIDIIEKSFKGKDYNYLQNSLNNLINIGLKDHSIVEEIIKEMNNNKLHFEIQESSQIQTLFLVKLSENPKFRKISIQMMEELSHNFMFLKYNQLENIKSVIQKSNDKFVKTLLSVSHIISENISKYQNISNQDLKQIIFKKKGIQESSPNYRITSFDSDKSQFILFDEKNKQEIIIQGVENSPLNSYEPFKKIFKDKQGTINLLMVQDQPLNDFDSRDPQSQNDQYYVDEINQMYKTMKDVHELKGIQLRSFLINCFNDESFVYDFEENQFKHRKLGVNENLNSLYIDFIKNTASTIKLPAKIILADMPISEYINSLVVSQPLSRLKETIRLSNFITLMEKTSFTHNTIFKTGCPTCDRDLFYSLQNQYLKKSPEAYLEILTGDKKFLPIQQKVQYFGDRVYQSLLENKEYKNVLVACGGFQLYDTVKIILENDNKNADYDGYDFFKYKDELKREFGKNSRDYLEKIALLEVLHEVIDNGCVRELTVKGKHRIDIDKYISFIDHYTDLLSFESISPNVKFSTNIETKSVKNCLADQLIFGMGEDKEYIEEQQESDQFFSILNKDQNEESAFTNNQGDKTIIEDEKPQKSFEELEKENNIIEEEIKRHEEKYKPQHYIDTVYNQDQLDLMKIIVDVINKKTLFTEDDDEQRKAISNNSSSSQISSNNSESSQNNNETGEKKNKIKFKKSVPRFSKNTNLSNNNE